MGTRSPNSTEGQTGKVHDLLTVGQMVSTVEAPQVIEFFN
jgi:hypothetical protein